MGQPDVLSYGQPPPESAGGSFGAAPVREGRRFGVMLMLKGWQTTIDDAGESVAFVRVTVPSAVQAVQAIRQAIGDARRRRLPRRP